MTERREETPLAARSLARPLPDAQYIEASGYFVPAVRDAQALGTIIEPFLLDGEARR